ncbi:MAG TPA: methyltransferase domain-containing protein [Bryobacteraceae bacterium]
MQHLYPRYRDAFARKRDHFQPLLPPGAEILEVGSHLGAFLEIAEIWGWKPIGLDIGWETSAFARRQGGTVKRVSLDDYSPAGRPDAIFIWNCFEQLDSPWDVMIRARALLSRHGLVVLRVPNAEFYRQPPLGASDWFRALSYNNLLGFPYLNGYSLEALNRLLSSTGFETVAAFATSLLTPPYPEMSGSISKEWYQTRIEAEDRGVANGPWIEVVGRAVPPRSVS